MEHPLLFLVIIFEKIGLGHFAHQNPHVIYSWLVIILLGVTAWLSTKKINLIPRGAQNFFEVAIEGLEDFTVGIMGEEGRPYFPLLATLFIYILTSNLLGLVPGLLSPTSNINTTLSCAVVVFIMTHYVGLKNHGLKYVKHFTGNWEGPMWIIAVIYCPIEIISHLSRVLSLTLRLFGNVMGEDLVIAILLFLAGKFFAPLPMMFMAIFTSTVQAFVFMLLSTIYISAAIEHAH